MTVTELMEHLKAFDPNLPVVVAGYEGGFNDVSFVAPARMFPEANTEWYYGAHEEALPGDEGTVTALLLSGKNHIAVDD
ncbi:MAG: hypothetical protein HKP13_04955 [Gammaproteobacteria bacterium]|nr:hypothetical protein [Gammaproteobacteria bacterium]